MQCNLKNRALVRVSGSDAEGFLQNQFSNDISKLNHSSIQVNAYCQHQGKIIALFWVISQNTPQISKIGEYEVKIYVPYGCMQIKNFLV